MTESVSSIRNLGPAVEEACHKAGIHSAEDLRSLGPDVAYARLIATGMKPHFVGFYAMVMGLQGRPWNDCRGKEKDTLKVRFEAIKRANYAPTTSDLDQILNEIGVIKKSRS